MFKSGSNKTRKILLIILVAFIVVNVFGLIILTPTPAYAQWVVTDPITGANTTIRNITDFIRVVLVGVMGTALLNGIWYFAQRIAYDSAVWLASGGKGQDALVFQDGFGTYLENAALDSVGEVIGSVDLPGFDLCRPPNLSAIVGIQLGIARRFQPPTPRCSWNDLSSNWDAFVSSASSDEVLSGLSNIFRPGQSGLGVAFTLGSRSHEFSLRREYEVREDRREGGGYRPVTELISGRITTPSQAVRQEAEQLGATDEKARDSTLGQAGSAIAAGAFQLLPATLTIFANTLLGSVTQNIFSGLYKAAPREERGPLFNPEASVRSEGGRARAQAVFADWLTPKFIEVQNYDALTEFMTCPGTVRGPNNCVIDAAFASIVRISESGTPVTISDAVKQGALHGDWVLTPSSDSGNNQDANCYTRAYCYPNLTKLRRARIIPIGWELAAEQGAQLGVKPTLQEVMSHFYDCDPATGGVSDSHPWCHLIDPNWVLKYPRTQCRALVKGPTLLAAETSVRADTCSDSASCIASDDKGNCVAYGYCAKERNVWQTPGESCPARYDSCQGYRKINSDGRTEKETFLLTNTADFNGCNAAVAGCSWYSAARIPGGTPESGWQRDERIYFNRNVEKCGAGDDGCTDLILKGAGVSKNLLRNSSFEVGSQADGAVTFWDGVKPLNYSTDSTQSYRGAAAVRIGSEGVPTDYSPELVLETETTYAISFYAKQAAVGGAVAANVRFKLLAGNNKINMIGRTNCAFFEEDPSRMLLRFTPGDSYSRASCAFTTPSAGGERPVFNLIVYGDEPNALWVDGAQLEEGLEATEYRESGYPANAVHATYKIPPEYLGCTGGPNDPAECQKYTLICAREDNNCELYTPSDGSPSVPGIATTDNICPNECVGYSTFRQEPTRFEAAEYPLFFIPTTGQTCEAQYAGCDEFTNLENESVEHYSYLRQCVRPSADSAVYYTWEGSDTTGFQLKVWNFLTGNSQAGEAGRPPSYRNGFTDYTACARDIFQTGFDPDCREFYDVNGNISYRLYSELVVATPECNRYRRSEPTTEPSCLQGGGQWDAGLNACVFLGFPKESRSCPSGKKSCRAYTGNAGRNIRIVKSANFETGNTEGFEGVLSSESVFVGGHSLQVIQIPGLQNAGTTRVNVGSGEAVIRNGGTYLITFFAKGSNRPVIRFSGDEGNLAKYFANANFDLRSDWQRYTLGPVLIERPVTAEEELIFTSLGNPTFIDDLELKEVSENIFLIKDSWNTPASCDQAVDGTPFPQAMLNCAEYKDTRNNSVNLTGFDRLCRESAVGCRAVIDTRNSVSLEEERFNATCLLPSICADDACSCSATVNGEVREVCQVNRNETSCRFNSIGAAAGAAVGGINYTVEVRPDTVIVPEDTTKYLVLDQEKACRGEAAGCALYGNPTEGICTLNAVCANPAGCNCLISNDVVCQAPNGSNSCLYKIPRYFLDGSGANYSNVVLKNNSANYESTLCGVEFLGCTEWQKGSSGLAYFKDPVDQRCEYRENVTLRGVMVNGWFKKGLEAEPCDPAFASNGTEYNIRKNGDSQYLGWTGICSQQFASCTAFLDPADSSPTYPEGRPYYLIKDERLKEGNDCNGRVSQKEGCVLFKDTSVPLNQYSSRASYLVSAHENFGLVPVSSCPTGNGCSRRCQYNFVTEESDYSEIGASCIEDRDCERDSRIGVGFAIPPNSSRCADFVNLGPKNDSNIILKVTRDRQCAEWLDCKTQVTVWDDSAKKFKKVCTQLGRCDSFITTADGVKCAAYKAADYSGNLLTLEKYTSRDVSWYGAEYAGFSIPSRYPVEELQPIDFDKTAAKDIRLAYVVCEEIRGADRNCDNRPGALPGACRRVGQSCGEPNSLGNFGRCVTAGGAGATPLCVYGIDGSSVPVQPEARPRRDSAMVARALPSEQCRAFPEQDSPFPATVSEWTQSGLPLARAAGFNQANVCEKFAWRDFDGDGVRDTTPAWPDPRAELIPQNCECSYSKAIYNGKSFTKYFGIEGDIVPGGICQGGPRSGESCAPEAKFNDKKDSKDPENLKTCGPQTQGGMCQKIERIDKVVGQMGQCLEPDLSLSLNNIPDNYACLTWNPSGIVPGGKDIYNQFASAGYSPSGSTGKYFCLEGEGNAVFGNQQSYEAKYSQIYKEMFFFRQDNVYDERFITTEEVVESVGGRASDKLVSAFMKDIAALRVSSDYFGGGPAEEWKKAVQNSVGDESNILSRLGKTGLTPAGREYWEIDFNIGAGQSVPALFVDESLIDRAVAEEENNTGDGQVALANPPNCANAAPGGQYGAIRAVFDNSQGKKLIGFWISSCDANADLGMNTRFDLTAHFSEPCNAVAKVEGSNAAFTDRTWISSGYTISDEGANAPNVFGSPFGEPPENNYKEYFMLGYGYENRNTPFGSAVSTQEPFGIEAWQITGPDGFGSPYTKYIPAASDAGSPYGNANTGNLKRCAASPYVPGSGLVSLNEGMLCENRTACPLQKVCANNDDRACLSGADCQNGAVCSAKRCGQLDSDNFTVLSWFNDVICDSDDQCANLNDRVGELRPNIEYKCLDAFAYADCTSQSRPYGLSNARACFDNVHDARVGDGSCQTNENCPAGSTCKYVAAIPTSRQSPLEFLFAKTFGIWEWSATPGTFTYGACTGNTPLAGEVCAEDNDCSDNDGTCIEELICSQGPQKGNGCGATNILIDVSNSYCNGGIPESRSICPTGEFMERVCPAGSDRAELACDRDSIQQEGDLGCYNDDAICNLNLANPVCAGGAFEDFVITDVGVLCPSGWRVENGKCRLPCASNNECRWSGATCGSEPRCDAASRELAGVSCTINNNNTCRYSGTCEQTTVTQSAGYQKLQSTAENPAPVGWDNREEATLGEQPAPPTIAAPDVSACDTQSQRCRVQGLVVGLNNRECNIARGNADCPTGWSCASRVGAPSGAGGTIGASARDTNGTTCIPPTSLYVNAFTINNRTSGDLRGAGSFRATMRFYAWADHNAMPITSRAVDWGDGLIERTVDSKYKNHKPICSAGSTDDTSVKECSGAPGLTCSKQSECPAGAGLCVPAGRCTSSRTRCSVDEDCPLGRSGVERCSLSRFGNSSDACNEEYFEFEHTYACTRNLLDSLPSCTGSELNPQNLNPGFTACKRDINNDRRADVCIFRPKVQVKDNWGFCNGVCPAKEGLTTSPGGLRCFESECNVHPGAWTGFGGFITIAPRN